MTTAPYGPYSRDIDPGVCVGADEACGHCRNCQLAPRWEQGRYDVRAVEQEIDRLRSMRKAPLSAAETWLALCDSVAYIDPWEHVACSGPRCAHDQNLRWYQSPHCYECRDPWPCETATLVCARIWLEDAHPVVGTVSQVDSSSPSPTPKAAP